MVKKKMEIFAGLLVLGLVILSSLGLVMAGSSESETDTNLSAGVSADSVAEAISKGDMDAALNVLKKEGGASSLSGK